MVVAADDDEDDACRLASDDADADDDEAEGPTDRMRELMRSSSSLSLGGGL